MELQIPSFAVVISFFLFMLMVVRIWKQYNKESAPPPGPWKLPLVGNIAQLVGGLPHHRLIDLAKVYGPIMTIQLGQVSAVVISSAETAKEVLKTQDVQFAERPLVQAAKIVLYNRMDIIFGSYGDHWRQMRKICTLELLSAKRVQSFRPVRGEEIRNFVRFLHSKAGTPVNLTKALFDLTNSIIAISSVGRKCNNLEAFFGIVDDVAEVGSGFSVADVFPSLKFLHFIGGDKSRLQRLHEEVDQILEDIIKEHKASKIAGDHHHHQGEAENLLDVLLDLQENGNLQVPMTNESIKAVILEMLAGSDPSTKSTEWAMSELMRNPKAMKKAQEEVRRVFGEMGQVDESRLQDLKFMKLVVKETLRLHPPVALIPRECREKTKVDGYDINPKTKVLVNAYAIGRDPNVWVEAEKFWPERFEESSIDYKGTNFELIPFGAGKRICPGMTLGTTNMEVFLANLLFHFDWKLPDGITPDTFDMAEAFASTLKRKTDLNLIPLPFFPLPTK